MTRDGFANLLGESPGLGEIRRRLDQLLAHARQGCRLPPFLLLGETGTGKGLVAQEIHASGPRATRPFVSVNCAAIPETLLEAELFGFERGAFTDARQSKRGLFQEAHEGTLFLDEVGLLPLAVQAKLLMAVSERTVRRLGSTRSEMVDVSLISATSVDLEEAVRAGAFRRDLYYRLAVLPIRLPPLRERGADILLLARHFLAGAAADYGVAAKTLLPDACARLMSHHWPGNIRELANLMERLVILSVESEIGARQLDGLAARASPPAGNGDAAMPATLHDSVDRFEREQLLAALARARGNLSEAARGLGISRSTLRYRIVRQGIELHDTPGRRRPAAP